MPSTAPPKSGYDRETILEKIRAIPFWWHYIELGHGVVTPGHQNGENNPSATWKVLSYLGLPEDLTGKRVLDIGAWDGYFSFEAERRGALEVVAIDNFYRLEKEGKHLETEQQGFEIAREILASKVEFRKMDAVDLSPEKMGLFDVVLFLGVLYHAKYPFLTLERIASVTKEMMILETHSNSSLGDQPAAVFYERDDVNADPTNWWGPNRACVEAMTRAAGFCRVECVSTFADRIVIHAFK